MATWQPQILHVELSQEVSDAAVEVAGPSLLPFGATTVVAIRLATGDGSIDDRLCDAGEDIGRNFPAIMVASAVGTVTGTIWLAIPAAWGTRWLIGEGTAYRQQVWEALKQKLRGTPAPIHDIRPDPGGGPIKQQPPQDGPRDSAAISRWPRITPISALLRSRQLLPRSGTPTQGGGSRLRIDLCFTLPEKQALALLN